MTGTLVGVLIFGFLGNILLLKNIDSNTQLVLKGLIILGAVLLQEGQMAGWLRRIRPASRRPREKARCGSSRDSTMKADVEDRFPETGDDYQLPRTSANGTSRLRADLQNSTNQSNGSRIILPHGSDEINKNKTP